MRFQLPELLITELLPWLRNVILEHMIVKELLECFREGADLLGQFVFGLGDSD